MAGRLRDAIRRRVFAVETALTRLVVGPSPQLPSASDWSDLAGASSGDVNIFFLHHSTGDGFLAQGRMRKIVATANEQINGCRIALWDHGYNAQGLRGPNGKPLGRCYDILNDNTDPDGLHRLWTSDERASSTSRDAILAAHQVIAFKSCFPASAIESEAQLARYKGWYREIAAVAAAHPDHMFLPMSPPPLHPLSTVPAEAERARAFATWLNTDQEIVGVPNIAVFDLFDRLAAPADAQSDANMLRRDYRLSLWTGDSHPNEAANRNIGAQLADFMIRSAIRFALREETAQ